MYIVRCSDGSFYTGCTKDLQARLRRHNGELPGGARYTRTRRPVVLVFLEEYATLRQARKREQAIKRLSRAAKEALIANQAAPCTAGANVLQNAGGQDCAINLAGGKSKKTTPTRIDLDELYKSLRKPTPKPTVVHRDRRKYSRKQKHPKPPEEET